MNLLQDLLIGLLTGYLALTNFLAHQIIEILPSSAGVEEGSSESIAEDDVFSEIPKLPSRFTSIPDILRTSVLYQQASLVDSDGFSRVTTKDPLEAIVNVFCTLTNADTVRTTTGSGFFIDSDGVIMTNAHVAQFLLLEESNTLGEAECIIRTGNPASPKYQAELLYIPPAWIQENAKIISTEVPMGTGERDYALLYISKTVDNTPLPAQFPALGFSTDLLPLSIREQEVVTAGYPARPLFKDGPNADLVPHKATTTISELYTFGSRRADVFSIKGSEVGAEGSSGGPVLNKDGDVIGIIVTRGDDSIDGEGSLRAITLAHVEQSIQQETNFNLARNLSGNLAYRSQIFTETMSPFLLTILQLAN